MLNSVNEPVLCESLANAINSFPMKPYSFTVVIKFFETWTFSSAVNDANIDVNKYLLNGSRYQYYV